jgi:hypothetical protein
MPFFLVDDQFHSHPKLRKAGLEAIGMWTAAGSWSQAYKQQGFVPEYEVAAWPRGKRLAAKLVEAGLWHPGEDDAGEPGWWFHDWLDIHPTADEIEKQRERARERQRKRRARLAEMQDEQGSTA